MPENDANVINLGKLARFKNKILKEVTQEEYKQLTPAEKEDVTFFIKDSSAYSQPEASAVSYDKTGTRLASDNVQDAISEIDTHKLESYVGMVIHSTTLDTMAKVVAQYGGTTWILHDGYMLRGASSNVTANQAQKDGGNDSVSYTPNGTNAGIKLSAAQSGIPAHAHGLNSHTHSVGAHSHGLNSHTHSVGAHSHGLNSHTHSYVKANTTTGGTAITVDQMPSHSHGGKTGAGNSMSYRIVWDAGSSTAANHITGWGGGIGYTDHNDNGYPMASHTHNITAQGGGKTHNHSIGNTSTTTTAATGSTANSTAFNTGAASGSTANSTAFNTGAASGNTANNTAGAASEAHTHTFTGTAATIATLPNYKNVYIWERTA